MNREKGNQIKSFMQLLLAAFIWGTAFVAQSAGMEHIGAFSFSFLRFIIGGIVLIPCMMFLKKRKSGAGSEEEFMARSESGLKSQKNGKAAENRNDAVSKDGSGVSDVSDVSNVSLYRRNTIVGGICCGIILCVATNLQQFGIKYTTVGKAGFITSLYIVLVPVFGIFLKRKAGIKVWGSVALAAVGLYLLCMSEALTIGKGDLLVLVCAVIFTGHILAVDYFVPHADGVMMSCIQFFTAGVLSGIPMLIFEEISMAAVRSSAVPVLYAGVLSSGVAYTLQIIGQKNMNPTAACMIMSLESVFSVLAGAVVLHQMLTGKELTGCVLMFAAIILSQVNAAGLVNTAREWALTYWKN